MEGRPDINWGAVGVAYTLSVITTVIIFVAYLCIVRHRRRRRQRNRDSRDGSEFKPLNSMRSNISSRPLTARHTSRQESLDSEMVKLDTQPVHSRTKRDCVSKWCSQHKLPEVIANVLRDNGFNTPDYLDSLCPSDVPSLGLPNRGTECLLRQVLQGMQPTQDRCVSVSSNRSSGGPRRYSGDDRLPAMRICTSPIGPSAPMLNKSSSLENTSDSHNFSAHSSGFRSAKPILHTEPMSPGVKKPNGQVPKLYIHKENKHGFNGLLSNPGLRFLASHLGREWTHLATELNVSMAKIDHLRGDHPGDTHTQIYHMLVFWRDQQKGSKEEVKGSLGTALSKVNRVDLLDDLMTEQVNGSVERVYNSSIL